MNPATAENAMASERYKRVSFINVLIFNKISTTLPALVRKSGVGL